MFKLSVQYQEFLNKLEIYNLGSESMTFRFMHDGIMHYRYNECSGLFVDLQIVANDTFLAKMPFTKIAELNFVKHFNIIFSESNEASNVITWTLFDTDFNTNLEL
jgi:hypothetical protein